MPGKNGVGRKQRVMQLSPLNLSPQISSAHTDTDRHCVPVCLQGYFRNPRVVFTKLFIVHIAYGHGSVLLRHRCDTLCTSSFVDDIMFFITCHIVVWISLRRTNRLHLLIYRKVGQNAISY